MQLFYGIVSYFNLKIKEVYKKEYQSIIIFTISIYLEIITNLGLIDNSEF